MKYDKKTEQLLAVPSSSWTMNDMTHIALAIKANPADNHLKEKFLNLDPRTGDNCNKAFYVLLTDIYSWMLRKYNALYTLDEYIECVIMHIFMSSLADWRPGDSLKKYIKVASTSHGAIGYDIRRTCYFLDAAPLDDYISDDSSVIFEESFVADTPEFYENIEMTELITGVMNIVNLSELEIHLLTELLPAQRMTLEYVSKINEDFGTTYTLRQLSALRKNAIHRVNYKQKELQEFIKKFL